ncbi:MAG: transcriptional repressor LexA [Myxococcota bacterium]|nr:transcriptional repressor LexA [Myxococcota bacterium]
MKALTHRQQQILDFISMSISERGYPPTIREIGLRMGIRSTNGVNDHLKALERKGFLVRDDLKSRAMRPVSMESETEFVDVPVLGRVAAGEPILAVENAEDTVRIDRVLLGPHRGVFGLRIVGESMIDDGIFDGDYVFVKKTKAADDGSIVIALIEDEATCKRIYREKEAIRFQPANDTMAPIYVRRQDFRETMIIGVVVGVYRRV